MIHLSKEVKVILFCFLIGEGIVVLIALWVSWLGDAMIVVLAVPLLIVISIVLLIISTKRTIKEKKEGKK